jgi:AcrR family transcriptional regulator
VEERKQERRQALLATALDLFATKGYPAVPIEEICRTSYVSTRYFYEEFENREHLLVVLAETLLARVADAVMHAEPEPPGDIEARARADIAAFVHAMVDDPRVGRVMLIETVGVSPALEARRRLAHAQFADYIASSAPKYIAIGDLRPDRNYRVLALGLVGAINEVVVDWLLSDDPMPVEELIDGITEVFMIVRDGLSLG